MKMRRELQNNNFNYLIRYFLSKMYLLGKLSQHRLLIKTKDRNRGWNQRKMVNLHIVLSNNYWMIVLSVVKIIRILIQS